MSITTVRHKVGLFDTICESVRKDGSIWGPIQYVFKRIFFLRYPIPILIQAEMRSSKNVMGRFGGGWNWKIGAQWSTWNYIIFEIFIMSFCVRLGKTALKSYEERVNAVQK